MEKKVDNYKSKKSERNDTPFKFEVKTIDDVLKSIIGKYPLYANTWITVQNLMILNISFSFMGIYNTSLYTLFDMLLPSTGDYDFYYTYSDYYGESTLCSVPCMYQATFSERRLPIIQQMYDICDKLEDALIDYGISYGYEKSLIFTEIRYDKDNRLISKSVKKRLQIEWENEILNNYYNDF